MGGNPNLWGNTNNNMHEGAYALASASSFPFNLFPPNPPPPPSSWNHLLFSGVAGEEKGLSFDHNFQVMNNNNNPYLFRDHNAVEGIKQEGYSCLYNHGGGGGEEFQGTCSSAANNWSSQVHMAVPVSSSSSSSPWSSSFTSCRDHSNMNNSLLDSFSHKKPGITKKIHHLPPPDHSSECSTTNGGTCKKARVQASSSHPPLKVRKEKLGDRISAIHQLVSPFGKTDTASVLLEAIGYIRFLHGQIEALCFPYFGNSSKNLRNNNFVSHGERNSVFPEDPGQLLNNDLSLKRNEAPNQDNGEEKAKVLRSRGLCLVPMSLSHHFGSDHNNIGADFWSSTYGTGF